MALISRAAVRFAAFRKPRIRIPQTSSRLLSLTSTKHDESTVLIPRHEAGAEQWKVNASERLSNADPTQWILPIPEKRPKKVHIKTPAPPPSAAKRCAEPLRLISSREIAALDPTGVRTRLFSRENPDCLRVRDIVLVQQRSGDPFAGVVLRKVYKGHDSSILVRNTITGVGVEMEFKIYSPNVTGIEVVQRAPKKPMQYRLYYMRHPKHDIGSVAPIVQEYLRQKSAMGAAGGILNVGPLQQTRKKKKNKKKDK